MSPRPRGPNPFDRWARSESGLHLPSRFVPGAAKRLHHIEKFGQCQCCCGGTPFEDCTFCGTHDGTDTITVNLVASITNGTNTWVLDGTYELTTKTLLEVPSCSWSDTFDIGAGAEITINVVFACVGFAASTWFGGIGLTPEAYISRGSWLKGNPGWSGDSSGDCVTRLLSDYGSPYSITFTGSHEPYGPPWVATWTSLTAE